MISVITGDIINSTKYDDPNIWLIPLKRALQTISSKSTSWEVFRGDSFQIEVTNVYKSLISAIYIKASVKMIKGLDVRIAIGIGTKTYSGDTITESNGSAFQNSGSVLENLKHTKTNLKIKGTVSIDDELNLYLKLIGILMDHWSVNSAEIVKLHLENENKIQKEIAKLIGISQDAVSKRMKRAYLDEILEVNAMFKSKIAQSII
ncbi:transcriptional regulator [Hanstruepera ponticola]|uniref:transcriptional regulator n=1 Tax=Hanstruepera ponticola TaxID=2042995 RepID=UPI001782D8DE|nr:transcriptional regulator [Hanstruepera ponticola]